MKRDGFFFVMGFFAFMLFSAPALCASGHKDVPGKDPVNTEYVFCVTALDVSALPPGRQVMGNTVVRSFAGALLGLDYRLRGDDESAYYRDYAWTRARAEAAKSLAAKRSERDLLVYRGDASWKYRKNLRIVDEAIVKLEGDLADIDSLVPLVEGKPGFHLTEGNMNGNYPEAPRPGEEFRFLTREKADAFLTGALSEYHGRIYLTVKMYTLHSRSYSFEDSALFSAEDIDGAMDEISGRLAIAISDTLPSGILVHATPENAIVLIGSSYAGRDEPGMRMPGEVEISARADNYVPVSVPLELIPGELSEVFINLTPLGFSAFETVVEGSPGSHVYLGAVYVGETPLTLQLPRTDFSYISVETPEGRIGSVVYRDNELVKGSAQFVRTDGADGGTAAFATKFPVSPEEKRVDKARRAFYTTYGIFWFILPASIITAGIAKSYIEANNYVVSYGLYPDDPSRRNDIYRRATTWRNVRIGAYSAMGVSLGVTFFQIFRYLYISRGDATPIVKTPKKEESGP